MSRTLKIFLIAFPCIVIVLAVLWVMTPPTLQTAILIVLAIHFPIIGSLINWFAPPTPVSTQPSTFYRLQVELTYKGTPLPLDVVVGCNVRSGRSLDGGSTYDLKLTPGFSGRRTPDGKAVVVRTPDACSGETSDNGKVPPPFLPLVIVYDNPDTLEFGWGYATPDAYDSPLSDLAFGGAKVSKATENEFKASRAHPAEVVTPQIAATNQYPGSQHPFGWRCWAFQRLRVSDEARAVLRVHWPADRPRYWWTGDWTTQSALIDQVLQWPVRSDRPGDPRDWSVFFKNGAFFRGPLQGMPARERPSMIGASIADRFPPSVYPASPQITSRNAPATVEGWKNLLREIPDPAWYDIRVADQMRGFAFCIDMNFIGSAETEDFVLQNMRTQTLGRVIVNGVPLVPPSTYRFFENDEFIFISEGL